jgi:hypothetical protein
MKKLFLILIILLPTLLFAQQDSTRQTFRIGHCGAYVAGVKGEKISREKLLNAKKIDIQWCDDSGKVVKFDLTIQYSTKESYALVDKPTVIETKTSKSEYFTDEMLAEIKKAPRGSTIFILNVVYGYHQDSSEKKGTDMDFIIN